MLQVCFSCRPTHGGLLFSREAPLELEPQELEKVFRERACGLDVHFAFVTACLIVPGKGKRLKVLEETFETNVKGLKRLKAWLTENGCEVVGMEATGVYWMPVYAALEGAFELEVANPLQIKTLRGQKTDRKDARWIAEQVRYGRIKRSFVPPPEFRDARRLARFRRQLIQARTTISNEIQRTLAESGITLAAWVSDILGVSGMAILEALAEGRSIQDELPNCLKTKLKQKARSGPEDAEPAPAGVVPTRCRMGPRGPASGGVPGRSPGTSGKGAAPVARARERAAPFLNPWGSMLAARREPKYRKLCKQLGGQMKARMAIAHKLALIIYRNLAAGAVYIEPAPSRCPRRSRPRFRQKRVADLGTPRIQGHARTSRTGLMARLLVSRYTNDRIKSVSGLIPFQGV